MAVSAEIELTIFTNSGGVLCKSLRLNKAGALVTSPVAHMTHGSARRARIRDVKELAKVIETLAPSEAITLGRLHPDLPDKVKVTTKSKLNGKDGVIARDREHLIYEQGTAAFVLLDFDTKGKPASINIKDFWSAMLKVLPGLRGAAHLVRYSTSSGLIREDTGEVLPGSDGVHTYIPILPRVSTRNHSPTRLMASRMVPAPQW